MILREVQNHFQQAIFDGTNIPCIVPPSGFSIYRNNIVTTLRQALQQVYPAVEKLVGKAFFIEMTKQYISQYPSQTPCLQNYGQSFIHFLQDFSPLAAYPYISCVAALEWALHEAYYEQEFTSKYFILPIDFFALGQRQVQYHPTCRLLALQFNILEIWQFCQLASNDEKQLVLEKTPQALCVSRLKNEVEIEILETAEYLLLKALMAKKTLQEAIEYTLPYARLETLGTYLHKHIVKGSFTI